MIYENSMLNILEDLKKNKLEIVAGDASFRTFYRIRVKNKKYILIYCTKEKKNNLNGVFRKTGAGWRLEAFCDSQKH